jgi:hypothetical protein
MKQTAARVRFKRYFGQANHYLVTGLVALHHLEESAVVSAPSELHTTWNPKDKNASIHRTRLFTHQAILGSAVDAIDMYISLLYRKPNYIKDHALCSALDGAGRSVQRKVIAVAEHYALEASTVALVDVLITWRNNVVHELADNTLLTNTIAALKQHAEMIAGNYRGLIVDKLPQKAEAGDSLTFKETASLISAAHHFVEAVDAKVLKCLDLSELCLDLVTDTLTGSSKNADFIAKYYSLPPDARRRYIRNWLANEHGISGVEDGILDASIHIARRQNAG